MGVGVAAARRRTDQSPLEIEKREWNWVAGVFVGNVMKVDARVVQSDECNGSQDNLQLDNSKFSHSARNWMLGACSEVVVEGLPLLVVSFAYFGDDIVN